MARSRPRLTLGGRLEARRKQAGLSVAEAARRAGVDRKAWRAWETDISIPYDRNHRVIEEFCEWEPGSVAAVLEGRAPSPLRRELATVTPLRPGQAPPDDDFIRDLRDMAQETGMTVEALDALIAAYWAEKNGADVQRRKRYLNLVREARG